MVSRCNLKPYLFSIWKMTSRRTNEFGANWAEQNAGQHIQARILRERICLRTTSSHLRQVFLSFLLTGSCVHVGTDGYDQHIFRQKLSTRTRGCMGSLQLLRIASWRVQFPKVIRYTPNPRNGKVCHFSLPPTLPLICQGFSTNSKTVLQRFEKVQVNLIWQC